jgi:hypothetical protein
MSWTGSIYGHKDVPVGEEEATEQRLRTTRSTTSPGC